MFFNDEIFFRAGPLALVWKAGNDAFKTKKGRNRRDFVAVINADIKKLCDTIRTLFPQMGTAHGIPLKKMATLVKGIGVIYLIKIEEFAKEVFAASIQLKKPISRLDISVTDVRRGKAKTLDVAKNLAQEDIWVNEGDPIDVFGPFNFDHQGDLNDVEGYQTPRIREWATALHYEEDGVIAGGSRFERTPSVNGDMDHERPARKRMRRYDDVEDADAILKRLATTADPQAHCLMEVDEQLDRRPINDFDQDRDLDFGNGQDFLQDGVFPAPEEPMETIQAEVSVMGPPTNMEVDESGPSKVMETPVGAGTRPENVRRRRNEQQPEPDETVMELGTIQDDLLQEAKGKRARRRLALRIDANTTLPFRDMIHRVNAMKSALNNDDLRKLLSETRALGKCHWNMETARRMRPLDFIASAGRSCGNRLRETAIEQMQTLLDKKTRQPPRQEAQRDVHEQTTYTGVTGIPPVVQPENTGEASNLAENAPNAFNTLLTVVAAPELEMPPPAEYEADAGHGAYEQQDPVQQIEPEEPVDPFRVPEGRPKRRERRTDELSVVVNDKLDERKSFDQLYPPSDRKKKHAARAFLLMLKMQANKTVLLSQGEPFGEILVEKL